MNIAGADHAQAMYYLPTDVPTIPKRRGNRMRPYRAYSIALIFFFMAAVVPADADQASLNKRYLRIKNHLAQSTFETPIYIHSETNGHVLKGEAYGLIHNPEINFALLRKTFTNHQNWCEFVSLHLNVKACTYHQNTGKKYLKFYVGRKYYEEPDNVYQVQYRFRVLSSTDNYFKVVLNAPRGPSGTRNYLMQVEAMKLNGKVLFRIISSYTSSRRSRFGTSIYLNTSGSKKIGFSVTGVDPQGKPVYVRGIKGIIERNVVRYYLAGKTLIAMRHEPKKDRYEKSLRYWFRETEKYSKQLHEMDLKKYLQVKLEERKNQLALQNAINGKQH